MLCHITLCEVYQKDTNSLVQMCIMEISVVLTTYSYWIAWLENIGILRNKNIYFAQLIDC